MRRPVIPQWDEIDRMLVGLLQEDADRTLRELGDLVGLSPSAVQRRISRYKSNGLLRTVSVVDSTRVAPLAQALVMLTLAEESPEHHQQLAGRLRARPEVQQCYALAGRWDYAVVLVAESVAALHRLGNELFKADENIQRYDTMFIFDSVKTGSAIPPELIDRVLAPLT